MSAQGDCERFYVPIERESRSRHQPLPPRGGTTRFSERLGRDWPRAWGKSILHSRRARSFAGFQLGSCRLYHYVRAQLEQLAARSDKALSAGSQRSFFSSFSA